jgi:MFS transporter, ACS family, D-galactonate transporter
MFGSLEEMQALRLSFSTVKKQTLLIRTTLSLLTLLILLLCQMKKLTPAAQSSRFRFGILAFVFLNVVINYMDRSNISVAGPAIAKDLHLNSVEMGVIFSAFGWTYATLQIPGGILVDRFGPRLVYTYSLILWSLSTLLQGFAKGFAALFSLRLATGAFEAPAYPANNRIVTSWFPDNERASAIAVYTSGQFLGLAFLTPALFKLQAAVGWKGLFLVTGLAGIVWGVIWYFVYRDPGEHKRVSKAELEHIEKGGGIINKKSDKADNAKQPFQWRYLGKVFMYRKLWGIYLGQFAINSTLYFFLTWFPTYLVNYRGMSFIKTGMLAFLPFIGAFVGILSSGFLSDYMVKRGVSVGIARKTPAIIGLLLSISIIGANYVESPAWIIFFMVLAFFGNGFASITWIFVSILSPKELLGLTGGVFNFIGQLASIIVPIVIGVLARDGNFEPALIFIGCVAFTGACSYIFLVGKIERIESPAVALS